MTPVQQAVAAVLAGASVSAAAVEHGVARSSVKRALRRRGVGPLPHPRGAAHWNSGRRVLRDGVGAGNLGGTGDPEGGVAGANV